MDNRKNRAMIAEVDLLWLHLETHSELWRTRANPIPLLSLLSRIFFLDCTRFCRFRSIDTRKRKKSTSRNMNETDLRLKTMKLKLNKMKDNMQLFISNVKNEWVPQAFRIFLEWAGKRRKCLNNPISSSKINTFSRYFITKYFSTTVEIRVEWSNFFSEFVLTMFARKWKKGFFPEPLCICRLFPEKSLKSANQEWRCYFSPILNYS